MERFRIVYADDDELCHSYMEAVLDKDLYSLKKVYNGFELLKEVLINDYDLIISDIEMPVLNGLEAVRIIKNCRFLKHIPVIVVSSLAFGNTIDTILKSGAEDYIPKPIRNSELCLKVEKYIGVLA